jgi:hypothetical protein
MSDAKPPEGFTDLNQPAVTNASNPPVQEQPASHVGPADDIELAVAVEPEPKKAKGPSVGGKPLAAPLRKSSLLYPGFHKRPGVR